MSSGENVVFRKGLEDLMKSWIQGPTGEVGGDGLHVSERFAFQVNAILKNEPSNNRYSDEVLLEKIRQTDGFYLVDDSACRKQIFSLLSSHFSAVDTVDGMSLPASLSPVKRKQP